MTRRTAIPAREQNEENSLKRKRDKPQDKTENPKLKEFLQVMQKPSNVSWNDTAEISQGDSVYGIEAPQSVDVVEAESEDEYEMITKKPKKESKHGGNSEELLHDTIQGSATEKIANSPELEGDPDPLKATDSSNDGKTDVDWLRSRTNRVLDLVDEDEEEIRPTQKPIIHSLEPEKPPQIAASTTDPVPEENAQDTEMETVTTNADEQAIRLSRRLFLRNLSYSITEDDLRAGFAQFGHLEEVRSKSFLTLPPSCDEPR